MAEPREQALWAGRYLTGGELVIRRGSPAGTAPAGPLARLRQLGRRLRRWALRETAPSPTPSGPAAELVLAWSDTTEARVAGAASRAWLETTREPSWQSPYLARTRAAFDGQAEVDQIIDLALRINETRCRLGGRPAGSAGEYWDRQHRALERAGHQLGARADALVRYRDHAARLSAELRHLEELERLERTAAEIDGLAVETAYPSGRGDGGLGTVTDEIAGVRQAMTELVELMTRSRP
ncbi:MAG: hypothetical protein ACXVXS_11855 [Blastococcus sp.]